MYKGIIKKNQKVTTEFKSDYTNSGSANLLISASSGESDSEIIMPGGSDSVDVTPSSSGTLRILLDVGQETDTGKLEVKVNGKVKTDSSENIKGDTSWVYNVI